MFTTIPVTVHILSQITELTSNGDFPAETSPFIGGDEEAGEPDVIFPIPEDSEDAEEDDEDGAIRFCGDGTLTDYGDRLELVYSEDALIGMEGCTVTLIFDRDGRRVSMIRSGGASAAMVFSSESPRQHCTYNTGVPGFPLELCIHTRSLSSTVTAAGGCLTLDYMIEIRGVPTERTLFRLDLCPQPEVREMPSEN